SATIRPAYAETTLAPPADPLPATAQASQPARARWLSSRSSVSRLPKFCCFRQSTCSFASGRTKYRATRFPQNLERRQITTGEAGVTAVQGFWLKYAGGSLIISAFSCSVSIGIHEDDRWDAIDCSTKAGKASGCNDNEITSALDLATRQRAPLYP